MVFMTGDAMARPLIEAYEASLETDRPFSGQTLFAVASSAAIFSKAVKERWMARFPNAVFTDSVAPPRPASRAPACKTPAPSPTTAR